VGQRRAASAVPPTSAPPCSLSPSSLAAARCTSISATTFSLPPAPAPHRPFPSLPILCPSLQQDVVQHQHRHPPLPLPSPSTDAHPLPSTFPYPSLQQGVLQHQRRHPLPRGARALCQGKGPGGWEGRARAVQGGERGQSQEGMARGRDWMGEVSDREPVCELATQKWGRLCFIWCGIPSCTAGVHATKSLPGQALHPNTTWARHTPSPVCCAEPQEPRAPAAPLLVSHIIQLARACLLPQQPVQAAQCRVPLHFLACGSVP